MQKIEKKENRENNEHLLATQAKVSAFRDITEKFQFCDKISQFLKIQVDDFVDLKTSNAGK